MSQAPALCWALRSVRAGPPVSAAPASSPHRTQETQAGTLQARGDVRTQTRYPKRWVHSLAAPQCGPLGSRD